MPVLARRYMQAIVSLVNMWKRIDGLAPPTVFNTTFSNDWGTMHRDVYPTLNCSRHQGFNPTWSEHVIRAPEDLWRQSIVNGFNPRTDDVRQRLQAIVQQDMNRQNIPNDVQRPRDFYHSLDVTIARVREALNLISVVQYMAPVESANSKQETVLRLNERTGLRFALQHDTFISLLRPEEGGNTPLLVAFRQALSRFDAGSTYRASLPQMESRDIFVPSFDVQGYFTSVYGPDVEL